MIHNVIFNIYVDLYFSIINAASLCFLETVRQFVFNSLSSFHHRPVTFQDDWRNAQISCDKAGVLSSPWHRRTGPKVVWVDVNDADASGTEELTHVSRERDVLVRLATQRSDPFHTPWSGPSLINSDGM